MAGTDGLAFGYPSITAVLDISDITQFFVHSISSKVLDHSQLTLISVGRGIWSTLIKENCYNSRTSDDIDMKLGPVTKIDKRNKKKSKKIDNDVVSESCDVIVIFRIFGKFRAGCTPDSGQRVCRSYVFSNSNLLAYKTEN